MRSQVGSQALVLGVAGRACPRRGRGLRQRGLGGGHVGSPSRLVTDKNQSSSEVCTSRRPYTSIPALTRRRLRSAMSSRPAPAGRVTRQPGLGEGRARGDPGLGDELDGPGGFGAVDLDDSAARAAGQLVDGTLADHPAVVDDRHRVAGALDLVEQVRRQDDGTAFVGQAGDHGPHLVHPGRVEAVHRLVEDEQLGVTEQAGGHAQALAHAHRVRGDLVPGAAGQADPGQRRRDPLMRVTAPGRGQQAEVLLAGQVGVETGLVDDGPDPGQGLAALGRDGGAEERHRAAVGFRQTEQGADQGGLACAVRAEVAEGGAAGHEQLDVVDRDGGAEAFVQAVGLDRPVAG